MSGSSEGLPTSGAPGTADDDDPLFDQIVQWYRDDRDHWQEWRDEAREHHDFIAGRQFTEDEIAQLNEEERPPTVFNQCGPFIDGICGLEINNRQEIVFIPRAVDPGEAGATDLMSAGAKWVREECNAEDEESDAFRSMLITGLGWTQTRMNYDDNPDGMLETVRVDELQMLADCQARKVGLSDARRVMWIHDVPLDAARTEFPDHDDYDLDAVWARDEDDDSSEPHDATEAPYYRPENNARDTYKPRSMVRQVEVEWWEYEKGYRVHTAPGQIEHMTPAQHSKLQDRLATMGQPPAKSVPHRRKVYMRATVGNAILGGIKPGPDMGGFTFKCMTGKRDRNKGTFYGVMRAMRDPGAWSNKWLSQALHIMNTSASSGVIVEEGVMSNPDEFQDEYSRPGSVSVVKQGGLARLKEKQPPPFPGGFIQLREIAVDALPAVTGVTPEMIGQVDREQAGVLELHRKTAAITVLADFFGAKRRYQKENARLLLWMMHKYIADGRLIKVAGQGAAKYVKLTASQDFDQYDVSIDEQPSSPSVKDKTWAAIQQLLPLLEKAGLPMPAWLAMMDYFPLPETLISQLKQILSQPTPPDPAKQAQTQLVQARVKDLTAKAMHTQTQAQINAAQAKIDQARGMVELSTIQLEQEDRQSQIELRKAQAAAALASAGVAVSGAQLDSVAQALQGLLDVHSAREAQVQAAHDRIMDVHGANEGADQQDFTQQQGQQQQELAQQQAEQAAQQPPAGQ